MKVAHSFRHSMKDPQFKDFYTFEYEWKPRWHYMFTGLGHFEIKIVTRPESPHPLADTLIERWPTGEHIRMNQRWKPTDHMTAQVISLYWLCCFSEFLRTGKFPKTNLGHPYPPALEV